jgi:flagellar biosynthesis/type III secretory pathway protein FliH
MVHSLRLETFDTGPARGPGASVVLEEEAFEDAKLAAYEQGYAAGWEDAAQAQAGETARLGVDVGRSLQALGFTFQDARQHVLKGVEPVLRAMTDVILPDLARATLAPRVIEALRPVLAQRTDLPVTLVLNPAARPAVEALLGQTLAAAAKGLPLVLEDEPSLGQGQAYLRFGPAETRIDLDDALTRMRAAVDDFFTLTAEERRHG